MLFKIWFIDRISSSIFWEFIGIVNFRILCSFIEFLGLGFKNLFNKFFR